MSEEVLFESERSQSRSDIAATLRAVADKLDAGESITLRGGDQSLELDPPERPEFEIKAEREIEGGVEELSVEFELEWTPGDADDGPVSVE
ncbi:amphi-Trp domain-containing protein [Natronoarchaeum philippinense]|uniref:Amphi-Trp domain-containing protein n=1 Tax=Natronoarchaeum philippinense TaxID=558529 RepID=A0A285NC16_NATPI|nr:amphi-Trp domain-containing protein [Natronoarchaeum philippinense]SNZ05496.1 amphi-Trp domain-containing protein [Natronoarchaeum philippinense]